MSKKLLLVLLAVMIAVAAIAAPPAAGTKIKNPLRPPMVGQEVRESRFYDLNRSFVV